MNEVEYQPSWRPIRSTRISICIAVVAILISVVSGWLAYGTSRRAILDSVARENLTIAQSIVNDVEFSLERRGEFDEPRQLALDQVSEIWQRRETPFSGSFLCVIERPGRIALHTNNPAALGKDVSRVCVDPRYSGARTVHDLLSAKGSVATENINFSGQPQLAGYAYFPALDALVVVHVPSKLVNSQIRKTALPWALAFTLMATLLISLSIALSHFGYLKAESAAERSGLQLRQSESRFQAIFNSTIEFIGLISTDGRLLEANEALLGFCGVKRSDVVDRLFWNTRLWQGDEAGAKQVRDAVERAAAGEFVRETFEVQTDERLHFIDLSLKQVFNECGTVDLLVVEGRLITEQRNAELQLAAGEARLRAVIDSQPECVKLLDKNGNVLNLNPAGLTMIEADSIDQVVHKSVFPLIDDEYRDAFRAMHHRVIAGETAELEFGIRGLKGNHRWMDTHASPFRDADGRIIGHLAVTRDITDRKLVQKQLRLSQFSVDRCSSPIFWIRPDASFSYVNNAVTDHFGFTREELLKMSVHDIDPAYPKEVWPGYWEEMRRNKTLTFETSIRRKDNVLVPVEITTNLFDVDGQELVFAFVTDITERKAAEERVRADEARFRALVENSYDVIAMYRGNGRLAYASPSIERVLGYEPGALIDVKLVSLLHPQELEEVAPIIRQLLQKENAVIHGIQRLRHMNGSYRIVEVTATNLLHQPGVDAVVAIFRDITDRTLAEERLREREMQLTCVARISTMGEIAAGIAHEIKQPLHAIVNFSTASEVELRSVATQQILETGVVDDLLEWNQGIKNAAQRASEIIQRLRCYARKTDQQHEALSVNSLIKEAIELMAFESRRNRVAIEVEIAQDLPDVFCDRIQVQQVLINLLQNANDALAPTDNQDRKIRILAAMVEQRIQIQVTDNGPGVGEDIRGRIFDAFFSTKPNGLGMGLAISRTIVENHGGRLRAELNHNGGATFGFNLPVATNYQTSQQEIVDAIEPNSVCR